MCNRRCLCFIMIGMLCTAFWVPSRAIHIFRCCPHPESFSLILDWKVYMLDFVVDLVEECVDQGGSQFSESILERWYSAQWIGASGLSKKRFPMYHASSMFQVAGFGRGSAYHEDLEQLPVDRGIIFNCKSILHLGIIWKVHSTLQLLYLWCELLYRSLTFSQFLPGEFINSHFLSSFQFFHLVNAFDMRFSKCSFSLWWFFVESGLLPSRCFYIRDWYDQFLKTTGMNLSLKFTNRTVKKVCSSFLFQYFPFCLCE